MQFNHTSHVPSPTRSKYGFSPSNRSRKFSSQWSRRLWFISGDLFGLDFRMLIARNRRNQHNETDHQLVESGRGNPVTISHYNAAIRASGAHRWPGRAFLDGRIGECIRSGTRRRGMSWPFFFVLLLPHEKISAVAEAPIETYVHIELYDCPHTLM